MQSHVAQPDAGVEGTQHLPDAHLCYGEGAHLFLEADQSICEFLDGFGAETVIASLGLLAGDEIDDAGEERASEPFPSSA
ncbi:hypothetical protein ACPC3D_24835 [Streptomyces cellulosae]